MNSEPEHDASTQQSIFERQAEARLLIRRILDLAPTIRYIAIYDEGLLTSEQRAGIDQTSSTESDFYEEHLVNPTLLLLLEQRGNIDCGGLGFVIVAYGNFFQLVRRFRTGHLSICIGASENPLHIESLLRGVLNRRQT